MAASKTKEERPEVPYFSDLGAALADDAANELVGNGHLLRLLRRARRSAALLLAARTQLTAGQRRQRCPKQDKKQNKTQSTKHPLKEDTHTHTHSRGQICGRATKTWSVLDWSNFLFKAYGTNEGSANEKGRISKERERESRHVLRWQRNQARLLIGPIDTSFSPTEQRTNQRRYSSKKEMGEKMPSLINVIDTVWRCTNSKSGKTR